MVNTRPRPAAQDPRIAPADADSDGTVEPSWPLTTWQGWQRFATTDPPAPATRPAAPKNASPITPRSSPSAPPPSAPSPPRSAP